MPAKVNVVASHEGLSKSLILKGFLED
jgi:hypothetical protein